MAYYGAPYDTLDDAASAAIYALQNQPRVADQEYMGLLVRDPTTGKYYRTDFQTKGHRLDSEYVGTPDFPLAGIVHSHPAQRTGDKYPHTDFSAPDINAARTAKVPNYIAAMQPNGIAAERVFVPGQTPVQNNGDPHSMGTANLTAHGQQFLAEIPIDEYKRHVESTRQRLAAAARNQEAPMGDTIRNSTPAITAAQRAAMVNAVEAQANHGTPGAPMPIQTPPPMPHAMDMGGAPQPLPPGQNSFGPPMGAPPVAPMSPMEQEMQRRATLAEMIRQAAMKGGS